MAAPPLVVEFHEEARGEVVGHMETIAVAGRGWVNLTPGLAMEAPPPGRSALGAVFSSRGPTVPMATWMPAQGRDPATAGIEHGEGPAAAALLKEADASVPEEWRVLQDHAKRGLVVATPPGHTADELDGVLAWLLRATGALCAWPRTGEWRALVYGVA